MPKPDPIDWLLFLGAEPDDEVMERLHHVIADQHTLDAWVCMMESCLN